MNKIIAGDNLDVMKMLQSNSVDTIITSPPYNKGYWSRNRNPNNGFRTKARRIDYDNFDDKMNPDDYEKWISKVIEECLRVLKPTGSLFFNHTDILREHQTHFPSFILDFPLKQIIIWNRKNTPKLDKSYFFPINEWVFWLQKTPTARTYFDRKKATHQKNIWEISPEKNNNHPAPFPLELPLNIIQATTPEGGLVLDPFCGSGTTCLAAKQLGRNYLGIDVSEVYCEEARRRIDE